MQTLIATYGPFAFGVVVLLLIWHHVVGPFLRGLREDRNNDGRANREAISSACQRLENRIADSNSLARETLNALCDTNKLARDTHRLQLEIAEHTRDVRRAAEQLLEQNKETHKVIEKMHTTLCAIAEKQAHEKQELKLAGN